MKKFNATKMMALLMALCLITSTFVGSTLAKYTTKAEASDSARVAKFGVVVTATSEAFKTEYDAKEGQRYTGLSVEADTKVVAPGTDGTLATTTIKGQPEVAVNVKKEATLTLTGWEAKGAYYCPITITVNGTAVNGMEFTSADKFIEAVEALVDTDVDYAPNTVLDTTDDDTITWAWAFENGVGQTDELDTVLGDAANATIKFDLTTTVTQID